ncbi:MAG: hypothetical protein LBE06_11705 [Azoarcus sp.]|jgi:Fe2+ or Zn2+ uptake regulation protein|nr:hypothetical protein [Azoarcus sp.]
MDDVEKVRRESMRWNILNVLNKNRPHLMSEVFLLDIIRAIFPGATLVELRRELDYLEERNLVKLSKKPTGQWFAELSRYGIDIAEYTVECHPGIARPEKYWG